MQHMKILMDADCLIKLTKSNLKEVICYNFSVIIPKLVKEEIVDNAKGHPDAAVIQKNLERKLITLQKPHSPAIRKLIRIGFETYVGNLYRQGKVTLREAARLLGINQIEAMNLFLDSGIKGNLDASDVLTSLERFVPRTPR
jgi:hypothetical protein